MNVPKLRKEKVIQNQIIQKLITDYPSGFVRSKTHGFEGFKRSRNCKFEDAVQEIFAVQVLPGIRFPEIIDRDEEHLATAVVLPDEALADVPPERLSHSKFTGEKPQNL